MTIDVEKYSGYGSNQMRNPFYLNSEVSDSPSLLHDEPYEPAMTTTGARPRAVPIAVNPVALVTTECITVTSSMRKHARWSHSSVAAILGGSGSSRGYERDTPAPPTSRNVADSSKSATKIATLKTGTMG